MTRTTMRPDDDDEAREEALAEAYDRGLALEKAGDVEGAAAAFREALALDPDDPGGVSVRLASLGRGDTPPRAPAAYVATLFDQHAEVFDDILVERLGYNVPMAMRQALIDLGLVPVARCLDLGCGTGLSGEALRDHVGHLVGVDLSEGMVEIADEKEVYDALFVADAEAFLAASEDGPWDLVVATDVLPYLGGLETLFARAAARLVPGGVFAFSSETLGQAAFGGAAFRVGPHQRFAHDPAYLARLMAENGLSAIVFEPIVVRYESGEPIPGHLVIARRD